MSRNLRNYFRNTVENNSTIQKALSSLAGSRCLITGANGIIGYALSRLIDAHTSADLFLASRRFHYEGQEMLSEKVKHVGYSLLTGERFDYIFHCATYSQPSKFLSDWDPTIRLSTSTLLDLLESTNVRFIFASSTEVYSGLSNVSTEMDNGTTTPQHARGVYIESKRVAEAACARSAIASASRIAPAAGPYASKDDTRVIFELIRRGRANRAVTLNGGHKNVRQYQYTGSCAFRMLVSGILGKEPVYNNAGPYVDTLENFAKAIADKLQIPYQETGGSLIVSGAADSVRVSMDRFNLEFPEMKDIDPTLDNFICWLVEDYV
jgi:UDP-glucuronate decarboxylase